jgi:hypothetical protein
VGVIDVVPVPQFRFQEFEISGPAELPDAKRGDLFFVSGGCGSNLFHGVM